MQGDKAMIKEEVDAEDLADVVSRWTGIPVSKMMQSEKDKLLHRTKQLKRLQMPYVVAVPDYRIPNARSVLLFSLERPVSVKLNWQRHWRNSSLTMNR